MFCAATVGRYTYFMIILDELLKPAPYFNQQRSIDKSIYRQYSVDKNNPLYNEQLVNIADYGLAGQAYWSRPGALGKPLPGVDPNIKLRKTVAQKLQKVNKILASQTITDYF